ncbi:hypothetical protein M9Y10_003796 [Tritrichomonas musculus]|uniref:Uncharacterized protein n=1 Tax=Tritrichomonas musculus TaxID=1915356 RepID=A0ABR2JR23_9EUKA
MFLFFLLSFLINSDLLLSINDITLNLDSDSDNLYLFLKNDFFEFRDNLNDDSSIYYRSNYTINDDCLKIALNSHKNINYNLFIIYLISNQIHFNAMIKNLNQNVSHLNVTFLNEMCEGQDVVFMNLYVDNHDFIAFSNLNPRINVKIIDSFNNQIIHQILPIHQRNNLIVCYEGIDCLIKYNFSINSKQNYLSSINDKNFEDVINHYITTSDFKYLRIFFSKDESQKIDFSFIPFKCIEKVDIFGHSQNNPQAIKIKIDNDKYKYKEEIENKITTKNIILDLIEEKSNVGSLILEDKNTEKSPFKMNAANKKTYNVVPNMNKSQTLTIKILHEYLSVIDDYEEESINFIEGSETYLNIENPNTNKNYIIKIMADVSIRKIISGNISINFKNCGPITVQFYNWEDKTEAPDIMINLYSNNQSDLNIISSKNKKIKYRHYDLSGSLFSQYPTAFVFCLKSAPCDIHEYDDLDPIKIPIDGDVKEISKNIEDQLDEITKVSIHDLIILLNEESKDAQFDFSYMTGDDLQSIKFINYDDNVNLNIINFPKTQNNEWQVINCTIKSSSPEMYIIKELISNNSWITGNVDILSGTFIKNVDLSNNDINFQVSSKSFHFEENKYDYKGNYKIILKLKNDPNSLNKIIFTQVENSPCNVNLTIEAVDENSTEIPVSFEINKNFKDPAHIYIEVPSNEKIIIDKIPEKIDFVVFNNESKHNIHQIRPSESSSNMIICYQSFQCADQLDQDDFKIDDDSTFISTKDSNNYEQIINSIKEMKSTYNYLRLIFFDNDDIIHFTLNDVSCETFRQVQLCGDNNVRIAFDDYSRINAFDSWVMRHVSFPESITCVFKELTVIDTETVFESNPNNIKIGTARFHCKQGYAITGLNNMRSKNINYTLYDLFPELDVKDYVLSIYENKFIANSNLDDGDGSPIISQLPNKYNLVVHSPPKNIDAKTFIINRLKNDFKKISITFEDINDNIPIRYNCNESETYEEFDYIFTADNADLLDIDQGNCRNVNTFKNGSSYFPLQTPTQSDSALFSLSFLFSKSGLFSNSFLFSDSEKFSKSYVFSESSHFSETLKFSESSQFTNTNQFSETFQFSVSSKFSDSNCFSDSFYFSESNHFSGSSEFSKTTQFTYSNIFSETTQFSYSSQFSDSNLFSNSIQFSDSILFSNSFMFSSSSLFSLSSLFSDSSSFSPSGFPTSKIVTGTPVFSKSSTFSMSSIFTYSNLFTPSFPFQTDFGNNNLDKDFVSLNFTNSVFNMTSHGFINEKNEEESLTNYIAHSINISFSGNINITESENFTYSKNLYFSACNEGSLIRLDRNLLNSVIGVMTKNYPTIILENEQYQLNIMNYERGYSTINIKYDKEGKDVDLSFKEVNNSNGYLSLNIDPKIRSISFNSLFMSRISSLEAKRNKRLSNINNMLLLEDDEEEETLEIIIKECINISQRSQVILSKIKLIGELNIIDDSYLIFKKGIIFSDESKINFIFKNSKDKRKQPILKFESILDSTPNKIVLLFDDKSNLDDISNFILIEASNFKTCYSWLDNIEYIKDDKYEIKSSCEYVKSGTVQLIIKTNKKPRTGMIIGIIVGCIVGIALIITIIIISIKISRRKKMKNVLENISEFESSVSL